MRWPVATGHISSGKIEIVIEIEIARLLFVPHFPRVASL